MRFAIFKGQTLHAVIESDPGKTPPAMHAEGLRALNGADSCVPIESDEHLAILRANANTAATIGAGFVFRGRRFSLSLASQVTISNTYTIRSTIPYPLRWADADDTGFVTMESAADIEAFYQAATLAVLTARSTGNAAKAAVIETEKG